MRETLVDVERRSGVAVHMKRFKYLCQAKLIIITSGAHGTLDALRNDIARSRKTAVIFSYSGSCSHSGSMCEVIRRRR